MTDSELDELERLHEAATPSDWHVVPLAGNIEHSVVGMLGGYVSEICVTIPKEDAALIVAARNALPGLIAAVREGRARPVFVPTMATDAQIDELKKHGSTVLVVDDGDVAKTLRAERDAALKERDDELELRGTWAERFEELRDERDELARKLADVEYQRNKAETEADALRAECERLRVVLTGLGWTDGTVRRGGEK